MLAGLSRKVTGKNLENRLIHILEEKAENDLSDNQYGFRVGRLTTNAVKEVYRVVYEGGRRHKIDPKIRNAFNFTPWSNILEAVEGKNK